MIWSIMLTVAAVVDNSAAAVEIALKRLKAA